MESAALALSSHTGVMRVLAWVILLRVQLYPNERCLSIAWISHDTKGFAMFRRWLPGIVSGVDILVGDIQDSHNGQWP